LSCPVETGKVGAAKNNSGRTHSVFSRRPVCNSAWQWRAFFSAVTPPRLQVLRKSVSRIRQHFHIRDLERDDQKKNASPLSGTSVFYSQ
jgi:hypothetical protein